MSNSSEQNIPSIVFSGAGNMAEAIVRGLIQTGTADPQSIAMLNRSNLERLKELNEKYGVLTAADPHVKNNWLAAADIVVLAMKPKDAAAALRELGPILHEDQLIVSVIAGLSISAIQKLLGKQLPVARTMPNTSSTIGLGATGIAFSPETGGDLQKRTLDIFSAVGTVSVIPEQQMEILTGVSGSGPAYVYLFMEAMIAAGIEGGLPTETARQLTVQTVLGAAEMMRQTGEAPEDLRRAITSPNGSTLAALEVLAGRGVPEAVKAAVHRAAERSREMGEAASKDI